MTTDPRGVWLTGDAVRIFHAIGIGHEMNQVGHGRCSELIAKSKVLADNVLKQKEPPHVNFHHSTFNTTPFHRMEITTANSLEQSLPEGFVQNQPKLGLIDLVYWEVVVSVLT